MKNLIFLICCYVLLLLGLSCSKEKPILGDYNGFFTYSEPEGDVKVEQFEITESSKEKIVINGSELSKDGKQIKGRIVNVSFSSSGVEIDGVWTHKIKGNSCLIKGNFTELYHQGGSEFQKSGTFEIKSK